MSRLRVSPKQPYCSIEANCPAISFGLSGTYPSAVFLSPATMPWPSRESRSRPYSFTREPQGLPVAQLLCNCGYGDNGYAPPATSSCLAPHYAPPPPLPTATILP